MDKTQVDFIRARAAYTAASGAAIAEEPPIDLKSCNLDDIDAYVQKCAEIHDAHNVPELTSSMNDARDAMFEWAKARIAAGCSSKPEIDTALAVFDDVYQHPTMLPALTELILTLRA